MALSKRRVEIIGPPDQKCRFALNEVLTFAEERETPYTVKAIDRRFAILTRPATEDVLAFEHEGPLNGAVIYTIVDSETMKRGPNDFVFNMYDYTKQDDIERCMRDLHDGFCAISQRRSVPVKLIEAEE